MSGSGVCSYDFYTLLVTKSAQDREAVFPTRQSLGTMKNKLKGAETGHSLLKRKSEALTKSVSGQRVRSY